MNPLPEDLSILTVKQLNEQLVKRGLPEQQPGELKSDLVIRLQASLEPDPAPEPTPAPEPPSVSEPQPAGARYPAQPAGARYPIAKLIETNGFNERLTDILGAPLNAHVSKTLSRTIKGIHSEWFKFVVQAYVAAARTVGFLDVTNADVETALQEANVDTSLITFTNTFMLCEYPWLYGLVEQVNVEAESSFRVNGVKIHGGSAFPQLLLNLATTCAATASDGGSNN